MSSTLAAVLMSIFSIVVRHSYGHSPTVRKFLADRAVWVKLIVPLQPVVVAYRHTSATLTGFSGHNDGHAVVNREISDPVNRGL
jgi:hypothetical protein